MNKHSMNAQSEWLKNHKDKLPTKLDKQIMNAVSVLLFVGVVVWVSYLWSMGYEF